MTVSKLVSKAYAMSKLKGWWDVEKKAPEVHMLIVSEIAEATEEARKGTEPLYFDGSKPEGELIELADAVIRIADYCGKMNWDLESAIDLKLKYNESRPYRHGNKKF